VEKKTESVTIFAEMQDVSEKDKDRIIDLIQEPKADNRSEVKKILKRNPALIAYLGDFSSLCQLMALHRIERIGLNHKAVVEAHADQLRESFSYVESSQVEKLLIDRIIVIFIQLYRSELNGAAERRGDIQRLKALNSMFNQSCTALARVRKILRKVPAIQVNIAEKQVNTVL